MDTDAESVLLSELRLTDWRPKSRLTFVKNFSDMQRAGRIDSNYFQPRYESVVKAIRNYPGGSATLGDLVTFKRGVEVEKQQTLEAGIPFVTRQRTSVLMKLTRKNTFPKSTMSTCKNANPKKATSF